ncbi:MAG: hypothetical protein ACE5ER_01955 [Nitrospinaceae bacterium]
MPGCALFFLLNPAAAQSAKEEPEFVSLGLISFSPDYQLGEDARFIVFKIRNRTTRSVVEIFGWVYRFPEGEENSPAARVLVNNPHRGGTLLGTGPHRPGSVARWRFPLLRQNPEDVKGALFTLWVNPKGLFFARSEPPPLPSGETEK